MGCLLQAGRAQEAALAHRDVMELLRQAAAAVPAATQSGCYSMVAKSLLLTGRVREATDCARIARDYADRSGDPGSG